MRNRDKIGVKMITTFIIIALISAIIGGISFHSITTLNNLLRDMYQDKFLAAVDLENTAIQAITYHKNVYHHISLKNNILMKKVEVAMHNCETKMFTYLDKYKNTKLIDREKEILIQFNQLWTKYKNSSKRVLKLSKENKDAEATAALYSEIEPTFQKISDLLTEDVTININQGNNAFVENGVIYKRILQLMIARLIIAFITTILTGVWLTHYITTPLLKIVKQANDIEKGDINQEKLNITKKDEIGELATAFCNMMDSLKIKADIIKKISNKDLSFDVTYASDKDVIGESLKNMVFSLNEILSKAHVVVNHVSNGLKTMEKTIMDKSSNKKTFLKIKKIESQVGQLKKMLDDFKLAKQ